MTTVDSGTDNDTLQRLLDYARQLAITTRNKCMHKPPIEELVSEANLAITTALLNWDGKSTPFEIYGKLHIKWAYGNYLQTRWFMGRSKHPFRMPADAITGLTDLSQVQLSQLANKPKLERLAIVAQLLRKQKPKVRRCIEWYYWHGYTWEEIGKMEGAHPATLRGMVNGELARIKEQVK